MFPGEKSRSHQTMRAAFDLESSISRKEELPMLSKCANPSCSTPLVYLREGKIFMLEAPPKPVAVDSTDAPKLMNRVEHFWLCGPCSALMTMAYDGKKGVQVVPKQFRVMGAAS
jgi:hypothetical protein